MRTTRRGASVGASLAALALLLTACGGGSDSATTDASEDGTSAEASDEATEEAADGAFPVTITGALGETTIEEKPERVVTLGWGTDIAYSLGTLPVGIEAQTWGGDAEGYLPWFRAAVEAAGDELPTPIANTGEYDIDAIIALEPDLILAPNSGLTQEQFDQLSKFTNVVAYPEGPWVTPVDEQIEIAAEALGVPEKAQELIDATDAVVAEAAAANPDLANYTFSYVYLGAEAGTLDIYPQGDGRVDLLVNLGLQPDPLWADYTPTGDAFTMTLGLENSDQLNNSDVIITWFNDEAERDTAIAQPLWQSIPAVQNGATYLLLDKALGLATTVSTPLSVPWAIDAYVPILNETVANVK